NRAGPDVPRHALDEMRGELGKRIEEGDTVVFGGRMAAGMTAEQYADMMILAGNLGGRVVVDTDSLALHHVIRIRPWLIKPNHHELQTLIGREMREDSELLAGCRALTDSGIENVLLTIGSRGLMAVTRKSAVRVPPRPVVVRNTVGAGDSALAGFLRMEHDGESLYLCAQFAARMAEQAIAGNITE
ncbi:MAG: PfkB family carbohydrate kinase, partial [Oscillospiraceae bacterium]|nr:PfkB family carbohydrate kinase [Oscillospiraceae bacterium]